jgi:hypothetical protein
MSSKDLKGMTIEEKKAFLKNKYKGSKFVKSMDSLVFEGEELKKKYIEGNIMKARSDLKKKGSKYEVETELKVKEGLEPKVKRALKKSIIEETNKKIKGFKKPVGFGIKGGMVELDDSSSSSEEDEPKKKIDKKELMNYAKMLAHLLGHIEDPNEPIDKKDYIDAKKLIDDMGKVKKGRGGTNQKQTIPSDIEDIKPKKKKIEIPKDLSHPKIQRNMDNRFIRRINMDYQYPELDNEGIEKKVKEKTTSEAVFRAKKMNDKANEAYEDILGNKGKGIKRGRGRPRKNI